MKKATTEAAAPTNGKGNNKSGISIYTAKIIYFFSGIPTEKIPINKSKEARA